jgi:hypothetical protein
MRAAFEITYTSENYEEAKDLALLHIGRFLGMPPGEVERKVDTEMKVSLVDGKFSVTAYAKLKNGFVSFGVDKS